MQKVGDEMEQVKLRREEDNFSRARFREPGTGVVKGRGCVLDAAVVGGRWNDGLASLEEVAGRRALGWEWQHVEVHLGGEALWRAVGGNPAGKGDEVFWGR